jgi:serine/threonine protein phosphatase PrpC
MAVEIGVMDENEALRHEDRHLITNFVGSHEMKIEIGPRLSMATRDTLVIGSDGLFDNLTTDELVNRIRAGNLYKQVAQMISMIVGRMTHADECPSKPDDLTLICFRPTR